MSIEAQSGDYNLNASAATVFNKTAAADGTWELDVRVGDGTKDLHTNAATLTLAVTVGGATLTGGSASTAKDAAVLRAVLRTGPIFVDSGDAITATLQSNNSNDTDVDVTVTPRRVADVTTAGHVESVPQALGPEACRDVSQSIAGRNVWHVAKTGNDSNDGKSFDTAKLTDDGVQAVIGKGDEVIVWPGTYTSLNIQMADTTIRLMLGALITGDFSAGEYAIVCGGGKIATDVQFLWDELPHMIGCKWYSVDFLGDSLGVPIENCEIIKSASGNVFGILIESVAGLVPFYLRNNRVEAYSSNNGIAYALQVTGTIPCVVEGGSYRALGGAGSYDIYAGANATIYLHGVKYETTGGPGTIIDLDERSVANVMDDAVPGSPTEGSINERLKALDDDWADGGRLDLILDDIPTTAEFEARSLVAAAYFVVGDYTAPSNAAIASMNTRLPASPSAVGSAMTLADSEDVYHTDVFLTRDTANSRDEYTVVWYQNGVPVTSGITNPTIRVVRRTTGADLVGSAAMTQVGSTGAYKYDSSTRLASGEAAIAVVGATIGGSARTWRRAVGRDV